MVSAESKYLCWDGGLRAGDPKHQDRLISFKYLLLIGFPSLLKTL